MQWKHLALLAALLVAAPALAREDESGGGGSGGGGDWVRTRSLLVRDAAASDPNACGHVEVRERGDRQRFTVEVERLTPGATVEVLVADAAAAMVSAGTASASTLRPTASAVAGDTPAWITSCIRRVSVQNASSPKVSKRKISWPRGGPGGSGVKEPSPSEHPAANRAKAALTALKVLWRIVLPRRSQGLAGPVEPGSPLRYGIGAN